MGRFFDILLEGRSARFSAKEVDLVVLSPFNIRTSIVQFIWELLTISRSILKSFDKLSGGRSGRFFGKLSRNRLCNSCGWSIFFGKLSRGRSCNSGSSSIFSGKLS